MDKDCDIVEREKKWHNDTFKTNIREKQSKWYSISKIETDVQNNIIIKKTLDLQNDAIGLDYGCGGGRVSMNLSSYFKRIDGIDVSDERINLAKAGAQERNVKNVNFMVMDAMDMKYEDKTFDIVMGGAILHHLDMKLAMLEICRVMKDDGIAVFIEPLATNPAITLYRKLTPNARTIDEHPLVNDDFELIKTVFPNSTITYYNFLTLVAVMFRNTKCFDKILSFLYKMDCFIFKRVPIMKKFAWDCMIELRK